MGSSSALILAPYVACGVMLRGEQYVTVGGYLATLSPLGRNIMPCAQSHRPCGNRGILLSCLECGGRGRGTSPATPLLQSPRVATASFHASHAVHAHVRPPQPLKKSGVAGSFLASATALHIALKPSLTFPEILTLFARDSGTHVLISACAREICAPRVHVMLRRFPYALAKWAAGCVHAT